MADQAHSSPLVAVVLNWNNEGDTAACLDSLLAQEGVSLEILLVDNASADGSGARLHERYPAVHYLETGENLGYAGGNNAGLRWALDRGAEWILVVNNDTVADASCLARLLGVAAQDAHIGALAPLIVRHDAPERVWFAGGHFSRLRALGTHDHEGEIADDVARTAARGDHTWRACTFLTGCCLLLRGEALRDVGLFRADFFAYVEDVELSLRLREAHWQLGWVPAARLAHRVPPVGTAESPMQITLRDRNRRRLVRDRYPLRDRVLFHIWFVPTRVVHLLRYVMRRDMARTKAILAGMTSR
ncbi:N/A [soil metagenome]